jgi:hypothetical protein
MPWLHQQIGNPILSGTLNLFFRTGVRDAHRGMRAFRRARLAELDLHTTGMGFASEDGHPRRQGEARHPPAAHRLPPPTAASPSSRASATAGATCASCSSIRRRGCS